jgi:hypothetical protein
MATLEERIQNLTQDINPMGSGVMSDQDAERLMIIQQPQEFISNPKGQSTKLRMEAMLRLPKGSLSDSDALRMLQMMGGELNTQALPSVYQTLKSLVGDSRNETVGSGVMSDRDAQIVMQALGGNNNTMPIGSGVMSDRDAQRVMQALGGNNNTMPIGSGVMSDREMERLMNAMPRRETMGSGVMSDREADMVMNAMPSNPMQPLVEMGFGEQVDIILGNPADSDISRQAQQQIINEMGTGMDIDSFLMEVNNLAPKGAMTNIDAEGIKQLMSMGRDGDTTIGHLSEGEVVIPAPVLEANPQAADMLEQTMSQMGIDPRTRVVDSTGEIGGIASINPETGFQEFGFLSKLFKKVKKLAPLAAFIPGVGPAVSGLLGSAGTAVAGALGKVPGIGGLLKAGATKLGSAYTGKLAGLPSLLARNPGDVGTTNPLIKALGDKLGFGGRSAELDNLINPATNSYYTPTEIAAMTDEEKRVAIDRGRQDQGGTTLPAVISETINPTQIPEYDKEGNLLPPTQNSNQGGMGMMGKLGIAGLAGLIGKLAYEEAKDQKGVPLTPLTQMDQLGRYNIEAEIARRTGAEAPSRVEFGLNPEGMPALSGGSPRNAAYGGIMNLNMGGMPRYNYGGEVQYFNQGGMPRYNYGGGVQYFNQGGAVAMAEGGDMDATINIEEFPAKDGQIDGPGTEVSDDIPAMLSDGEFVMTAKAVKGAGAFNINDNNGILTLTPNGDPSRDSGTRVMYKLMEHFGKVA